MAFPAYLDIEVTQEDIDKALKERDTFYGNLSSHVFSGANNFFWGAQCPVGQALTRMGYTDVSVQAHGVSVYHPNEPSWARYKTTQKLESYIDMIDDVAHRKLVKLIKPAKFRIRLVDKGS